MIDLIIVDKFFLQASKVFKSSRRRQLEKQLDSLSDNDLIIMEGVAYGVHKSKKGRLVNSVARKIKSPLIPLSELI